MQGVSLKGLWQHRWLLWRFFTREIQNRYAGSVAGYAWAFVHPLVLLGIYTMLFLAVFKVRIPEMAEHPFVVFMALAMWPWLAFSEGLSRGTQAIVANAALIKKVSFPHELLVYAAVLASFAVHISGFVLVLVVLAVSGVSLHWGMFPVVALCLILLLALTVALALIFSAVQAFMRDFEQLLAQGLAVLFYLTPILYPMSVVPEFMSSWMGVNPLVHLVEPLRQALLWGQAPAWWAMLAMLVALFVLQVMAHWVFHRLSPHFEDVT